MSPTSSKPAFQFARYLLVGGFNSAFGYGLFALFNWLFSGWGAYSYMYAAVISNFLAISAAFLGYKWFVFRTKGNYLREWIRCFGVYGTSALIGLAGLPILVTILRPHLQRPELASYLAAAIMMAVTAASSFVGHKYFSFKTRTIADVLHEKSTSPPSGVPR